MKIIENNGEQIALIYKNSDWQPGLNFPTGEQHFLQVGCWQYDQDKDLKAHFHKVNERIINKTQELVFIKQGLMQLTLYDQDKNKIDSFVLKQGDFAVMFSGGHGYKILANNTQVLEVKNGPFLSVEKDKELI